MTSPVGEDLLDDADALDVADRTGVLRGVASAPAQLRESTFLAADHGVPRLAEDGRPRALVVLGDDEGLALGELLSALAGPTAPAPVVAHRGHTLPAWIGAADVVVVASAHGRDEDAFIATDLAGRRGARVLVVTAPGSPVAAAAERVHAVTVPVPAGRVPHATFWSYAGPVLVLAESLGLLPPSPGGLGALADLLDELTERYKAAREVFLNPAKSLALDLVDRTPVAVHTGPVAGAAAVRWGSQLWAAGGAVATVPVAAALRPPLRNDPDAPPRAYVVLRAPDESGDATQRVDDLRVRAREEGVPVHEVAPDTTDRLHAAAELLAHGDFTAAYLGLALGHG